MGAGRLDGTPLGSLLDQAEATTQASFGATVTYSRKVFIPRNAGAPYLSIGQVLEIARVGEAAGCREALFTLGDRPRGSLCCPAVRCDGEIAMTAKVRYQ